MSTSTPTQSETETAFTTINPANGEVIDTHPQMSWEETEESINQCHKAFLEWRLLPHRARAEIIEAIGDSLQERKADLAELMTREMGKLVKHGHQEIELCAQICKWTAQNGPEVLKDDERELPTGGRGIITYAPTGVIYGIQPWNFPAYQVIRYAIASLMAGNGVLLKHAASVLGSAKMLEDIFLEAGLPHNLFKVLVIDHDQSDKVIAHRLVRGVTLTGSPSAGKIIAEKAGASLKKTVMELGSNDAYLILEDANLEHAVKACVVGRTYNNGETCVSAKRFIVVDEVYEEFKNAFVERMKKVNYGDPTGDDVKMGPMARKDLRKDLHEQVEKSVERGAEILCGGKIPDGPGYYYPATVLANVVPGQPAYDEEFFGPVASLIHAKDADDAMRIANDSRFGLGGGIFSEDVPRATALAQQHFDTGMVFINFFGLAQPNMPFGGVKDSGYGREHGGFGLKEFVNAKSVLIHQD